MKDGTENTQPEVVAAPESQVASKPELPQRDYFASGKMLKYAEQAGLLNDEKKPEPAAKAKAEPPAVKSDGAPPADKPFRVIAMPDGRQIPVKTEADYEALAAAGARAASGGDKEQSALQKLLDKVERLSQPAPAKEEAKADDDDVDLDLIDPGIRKIIERQRAELDALKGKVEKADKFTTKAQLEEAGAAIDNIIIQAREKNPFDKVVDKDGNDITQEAYIGLVISKVNQDQQMGVQKPLQDYLHYAAARLSAMQGYFRGAKAEPLTVESIKSKNPSLFSEIGQQAVAEYLKGKKTVPSPHPATEEAKREKASGKGSVSGLTDAFAKALADPSLDLG